MNDEALKRLLHSAAQAPIRPPEETSVGLETRVLAHWRAAQQERAKQSDLVSIFRPAMLIAALIACLSVSLNLDAVQRLSTAVTHRDSGWNVAESAMRLAANP